ncbi:MAG: hypothetical protein OXC95_05105 [Dehalococcoidia bacterium]|nr:hypothetical protein [Dehalococcoidia bacterium]
MKEFLGSCMGEMESARALIHSVRGFGCLDSTQKFQEFGIVGDAGYKGHERNLSERRH